MKSIGFTLIELSIVIIIIGLVIGGVLFGKDLIKSAENRAYVSQLEKYNTVVHTFKTKYNCLPGDCVNATDYSFSNNGNGNGMVSGLLTEPSFSNADYSIVESDSNISIYLGCSMAPEPLYLWEHLQSALLIPENIKTVGLIDGIGQSYALPPAKNDDTGIILTGWRGKHYFRSGSTSSRICGNLIWNLNFSPADAAYIFNKMGGSTITTTNAHVDLYPDGLGKERVIVSGGQNDFSGYDIRFYHFQSQGSGGIDSDVCIDTSVSPPYFNLKNPKKLCALIIQAGF